jgi:hypothetical protein
LLLAQGYKSCKTPLLAALTDAGRSYQAKSVAAVAARAGLG